MEARSEEETWNPASSDIYFEAFPESRWAANTLSPVHPAIASSLSQIFVVYRNQGKYVEALKYFEDGLEMHRKCLPENHPNIALGLYNIGVIYKRLAS